MPTLTLHALAPSHPCMTADAALRLKGLEFERVDFTPGPHIEEMAKIYGEGNTTVPGLTIDDEKVHGSRAILARLELLVTGDTGPMHLASAVGTPVVAVFGPSDPARYATSGPFDQVVRIDLPCSPCNRIRRPPERCVGHTPDCLAGITANAVFAAASSVLDASAARLSRAAVHD